MTDAKLLAELMLQLSIYFESNTDDIAEWLMNGNTDINLYPMYAIKYGFIKELHKYVMEKMV